MQDNGDDEDQKRLPVEGSSPSQENVVEGPNMSFGDVGGSGTFGFGDGSQAPFDDLVSANVLLSIKDPSNIHRESWSPHPIINVNEKMCK